MDRSTFPLVLLLWFWVPKIQSTIILPRQTDTYSTCPKPVQNFDIRKYSHTWYVSYLSKYLEDIPANHCFEMKTIIYPNHTAISVDTFINPKTKVKNVVSTPSQYVWTPNIGQYYVRLQGSTQMMGPVNIFSTDYSTYSFLWHCLPAPTHPPVMIFTREKVLSAKTKTTLSRLLTNYGLNDKLIKTPDCTM